MSNSSRIFVLPDESSKSAQSARNPLLPASLTERRDLSAVFFIELNMHLGLLFLLIHLTLVQATVSPPAVPFLRFAPTPLPISNLRQFLACLSM